MHKRLEVFFGSVDHAVNALLEVRNVEVEQQSEFKTRQAEVRQQLGLVDRKHFLDAFDFDQQAVLHNEINSVRSRQHEVPINERQMYLVLNVQFSSDEFMEQAGVHGALQDACAQLGMNLNGGTDHRMADGIWLEHWALP